MNCLVVSDTHGRFELLKRCLAQHASVDVDLVLHLGDNYADINEIYDQGFKCIGVPGTWCSAYQDPLIDNRRIEMFNGWSCLLTHTPSVDSKDLLTDLDPVNCCEQGHIDFMLHGHTHKPDIYMCEHVCCVNPGHLKATFDRGFVASYAMMSFYVDQVTVDIIDVVNEQNLLSTCIKRKAS